MKKQSRLSRFLAAGSTLALASALSVLVACGGGGDDGGGGDTCGAIATSPGSWDITLNVPGGNPPVIMITGLSVNQNGCSATMSGGDGTTSGTFNITSDGSDTGFNCSFTISGAQNATGNFSGNFADEDPSTSFTVTSGTSSGGAITGGSGAITE